MADPRCSACGGQCIPQEDGWWTCRDCGAEWNDDHDPKYGRPRLVLHQRDAEHSSRWFRYQGRDFLIAHQGEGWGYQILTTDLDEVSEGQFHRLWEIREGGAAAVDSWLDEQEEIEYMRAHDGERRPGTRPEYGW
jgi:hypothetical protein